MCGLGLVEVHHVVSGRCGAPHATCVLVPILLAARRVLEQLLQLAAGASCVHAILEWCCQYHLGVARVPPLRVHHLHTTVAGLAHAPRLFRDGIGNELERCGGTAQLTDGVVNLNSACSQGHAQHTRAADAAVELQKQAVLPL
jgi:hypothetical protein